MLRNLEIGGFFKTPITEETGGAKPGNFIRLKRPAKM